uniref:Retrovirus-related Pol polyprotein from transposon TNT 1-94 n=1 Tax=Tanacetum cinerariifolium TaxID=118510 RepID=A0A6L2JNQ9_TANCI|nr:hypothetical protein [Tanacetum cinerariifolium]
MNVRNSLQNKKSVVNTKNIASVQESKLNVNFDLQCVTFNGFLFSDNHDSCVLEFINSVNAHVKSKFAKKPLKRKVWKPTGKVFTNIGYKWRPIGMTFTIVGNACPLTGITITDKVPLWEPIVLESNPPKHVVTFAYSQKPKESRNNVPVRKSKINKLLYANKKEPNKSWGSTVSNVPSSSVDDCRLSKLFSVKFGNDHVAKIMGYGDYQIENVTISRVYFVEGLGHNLSSVGQFCDLDLEVGFHQHTCFIRNLEGVDLVARSQGNNLYTLSLGDMMAQGLVRGLPKLKFKKEHLCSACAMGKSKKKSHKSKFEDTNQEKLYLLHMDLCGPMCVKSVNGKKYILVIVDDYSRFTWVKCLRSKDEAPDFIIKFLKMIQVRLKLPVRQAVATACYTQNCSIVRLLHGKTQYELLYGKLPDLLFLHVFGTLCYPTNDSDNLGKLQPKADIAPEVISPIAEIITPVPSESTTPSSTTVDQDAPSPSKSQTTPETQPPVISNDVEEDNHDIEVAHMGNDPFFGIPIPEVASDQSSLTDSTHTIVHPHHQISQDNSKWTKDHPLENIIGLQISQSPRGIFINQSKYALELLMKYGFESCDPMDTPMVEKSKLDKDKEGKAIDPLHYHGSAYRKALTCAFADADYAGCQDTRRSIISKHINIRYHFIKEHVKNGVIELYFVNSEYQLADIFTKALGRERIEFLINKQGMRSFTPETLKQLIDEVDE